MLGLLGLPLALALGGRELHQDFYSHVHSYDELIREIEHHESEFHQHDLLETFSPPLNQGGTVLKGEIVSAVMPPGYHPTPLNLRKERADVHRDGDWHRAVHVWLTDGEGQRCM